MNNSSKREQSHAGMNYAERENFRRNVKTFMKIMVAVIAATGMVLIMAQYGAGFKACLVVYMCVGIMMSAILGVFSERKREEYRTKYGSIKHRMGYRRAA